MRKHLPFIVGLLCGLGLTAYAATNVSLTKDHVLQYLNYIGDSLVIGNNATTTDSRLEVNGQATARNFNATSTTNASVLPYASTTMITGTSAIFSGSSTAQTLNTSSLTIAALSGVLKAAAGLVSGGASTSDVPEGSNLYYTDTRGAALIAGTTTTALAEGTNQYFTVARARSAVSGLFLASSSPWTNGDVAYVSNGGLTSVATGTLSCTSPMSCTSRAVIGGASAVSIADAVADGATKGAASFVANDFTSSSGNIGIDYTNGTAASAGAKGFLTSTDWSMFNAKVSSTSLSGTSPIGYSSVTGAISCTTASAGVAGCLNSTDWSTFNGKENALTFSTGLNRAVNTITVASWQNFTGASTTYASTTVLSVAGPSYFSGAMNFGTTATSTLFGGGATSTMQAGLVLGNAANAGGLYIPNGGLRVANLNAVSCDVKADTNGVFSCGTDATGAGGGGGVGWASSTPSTESIYSYGLGYVGIGTSTPRFALQVATGTVPQLALTDPNGIVGSKHLAFRFVNGTFYMATTSDTTFATNTTAMLTVRSGNGSSTFPNGITVESGCFSILGTCIGSGGTLTGSLASSGRVPFWTSANNISGSDSFFFNIGSQLLGLATSSPFGRLSIAATTTPHILLSDPNGTTDKKHTYASSSAGMLAFGKVSDALSTLTEYFRINNSGQIYMGTTTNSYPPSVKLITDGSWNATRARANCAFPGAGIIAASGIVTADNAAWCGDFSLDVDTDSSARPAGGANLFTGLRPGQAEVWASIATYATGESTAVRTNPIVSATGSPSAYFEWGGISTSSVSHSRVIWAGFADTVFANADNATLPTNGCIVAATGTANYQFFCRANSTFTQFYDTGVATTSGIRTWYMSYDTSSASLWYVNNGAWTQVSGSPTTGSNLSDTLSFVMAVGLTAIVQPGPVVGFGHGKVWVDSY